MTLLSSPATWKIAHKRRTFAKQINLHASSRGFVLHWDHPADEFASATLAAVIPGLIGRSGVNCSATTAITMRGPMTSSI